MNNKVSIIVPIYRVENYIEDCIDSICNQTFSNTEIILVDDGSKDESIAIAKKVLGKYKKSFKVILQKNKGPAAARNLGIKNATGDWIICIDSDDIVDKRFIEALLNANLNNQTKISIANYMIIKKKGDIKISNDFNMKIVVQQDALERFLRRQLRIIVPGILIEKEYLIENELYYDEKMRFSEDQVYIWRILFAGSRFSYIVTPLYYYHYHEKSIMTSSTSKNILTGYYGVKRLVSDIENGLYEIPQNISTYILPRWVLSALKSSSRMLNYESWENMATEMEYNNYIVNLGEFPDFKVRILSIIMRVNKKIFYQIARWSII